MPLSLKVIQVYSFKKSTSLKESVVKKISLPHMILPLLHSSYYCVHAKPVQLC